MLVGLSPADQRSIEVLGALGPRTSRERWARTCRALGLPADPRALEPFQERLLIAAAPGEPLRVLHPRLVDALAARAAAGGRWTSLQ